MYQNDTGCASLAQAFDRAGRFLSFNPFELHRKDYATLGRGICAKRARWRRGKGALFVVVLDAV